jgi:hypothetical protein
VSRSRVAVLLVLVPLLLASFVAPASAQAPVTGHQTIGQITAVGTFTFGEQTAAPETLAKAAPAPASPPAESSVGPVTAPFRSPKQPAALSAPKNPSALTPQAVPPVADMPFEKNMGDLFGFMGLTHLDQRLAGTGEYSNTQFSLEPPDQGLCVGNGFVVEPINTAVAVYDMKGHRLTPVVPLNEFFGLAPEVVRTTPPVYGPFTSDPKCYFDSATNRFFLTLLEIDTDPATGAFGDHSATLLAVSKTGNPIGPWNLYSVDTTDDGTNGTPSHPGCPCFGDQPLIGADMFGFYITTNEFSISGPEFNGAQVYALSKLALAAGKASPLVHIGDLTLAEGPAYSLQPATTPPGGEILNGFTLNSVEYFLSALDFNATTDNRIAVWALDNTRSLLSARPNLNLTNVIIQSEIYGQPPAVVQKPGPTPLGTSLGEPEELIETNDDRMNQVVYAVGQLWSGVNTVIPATGSGGPRAGIAYFIVHPWMVRGQVQARMTRQGYVAPEGNSAIFPSIGVNAFGKGAMAFTLVGPDYYPSAAYVKINVLTTGPVRVAALGQAPEDGFSGYPEYGGSGVARWGDYSAAVADRTGNNWMATEYIPDAPRTELANWGTYIYELKP